MWGWRKCDFCRRLIRNQSGQAEISTWWFILRRHFTLENVVGRPTAKPRGQLNSLVMCCVCVHSMFVFIMPVLVCVHPRVLADVCVTQTNPIRSLPLSTSIFTSPLSEIKLFSKCLCRSIATFYRRTCYGVYTRTRLDSNYQHVSVHSWLSNRLH